jgi:RHS repeat-associated protein
MYSFLQQTGKWWLLTLLLVMTGAAQAQTGTGVTFRSVLDGSQGQLVPSATANVEDSVYFDPSQQSKLVIPYDVRNVVTFKINEYSNLYLPAKFTATVNLHVIFTLPDMSVDSVEKTLVIDYDTASTYALRNSFVFNSSHRVTVRIMSVTSDAGSGVLNALMLENELQAWPVYNLSCTADAVTSIGSPNPPPNVDTTDEIPVQWTAIKGADEYDLEWAYIDSTALLNNRYGNPVNAQLVFENNASRVTVKDNTYRIPLLYDNGGVLYYRVRAVQQKGNARVETAWSSNSLPGGLGIYNFCGHQRNLNWQSSLTFAEEGKRKAVVQYYDGSLRSRQTVTKDNSTNTTLVSESFYDYQGRPVVNVLPAPTLSNVIKYTQSFNRGEDANGNGIEYDKDQYDHMDDPSQFLSASAKPMSKNYGASKYYSDQTPNKEEGLNSYIPDAGKYAFTETSYTQDNTNRISRQGGVGPTYKLGGNHETKYYYGTAAQKELDALFGTEVGDETHYFKNMVRDANGQYAVTYMDMHGRTIATALAGDPDSAQLAALPSNVPFSVTDTLSGPGKNQVNDLVIERSRELNVAVESDYNFHYELTPPVLHKEGCTTNQCYKALYNLEIIITDNSYNQLLGGQPFDTTISVSGPFVADCNTQPSPIVVDFTLPALKRGTYHINKRLTISREGMEYYRDNIFMADNTCKTLEEFIQEQRQLLLTDQCTPSCQSCTDSIGTWEAFRVKYMDRAGITEDTAAYRGEAMAAYQAAVAACNELCNVTSQEDDIRKSMLLDVSAPSGQYANVENQGSPYSIFRQPPGNAVATYRRSDITYLDEAGKPDMVYTELGDKYVKPQDLVPEQFAAAFKDSWAPALLPFHPEYCKLLELEKHSASNLWDKKFEAINTYAEAKAKGYLNPTGRLTDEFANFTPPPVADQDPLSKESGALRQQLEDRMRTYSKGYDDRGYQVIYTIWSAATATTKCPGDNTACTRSYQPISEAFNETKLCAGDLDMAWRSYRQYYLQVKRDIINGLVSNASCGAAQGNVRPDILQADGKHPNFNSAIDALNQNGLNYMTSPQTTKEQAQAKGQEELNKYNEDNCVAYSKAWAQQLAASCPYYNQAALDVIIPKLIMVCKEGSDLNHTNGASSVRPTSTYPYRSFADVIAEYNQQHGITNGMICNAEVITSPKPYDRQPVYGVKTTYSTPEDCECSKLNILHTEFVSLRQPADSNFSAYLLRTRKVKVLQSVLIKLLAACNEPAGGCTYLSEPLGIPGFMQCYTAPACATCQVVDSLYESFYDIYNVRPTLDEADTTKRNINQLFAGFMNNRLGFAKQAWEYIRFVDSCRNVTSKDTVVCEPTLELVKNYSGGTVSIFDMIRTADNGYLLAGSNIPGSTSSFSTMTSNPMGGKEAYLIKTDSKGVLQWSRMYGGTEDDEFMKIKSTSDGGYIAIGTTKSGARTASTRDAFIVKLTAEGNVVWSRAIGFNTNSGETGNDIVEMAGGGYAFTGGYNLAGGTADWLIGALTADGNVRWMKRMGSTTSDPYLVLMPKGDTLVFAGATTYGNEYNAIVMKMNGNTGQYLNGMRYDVENWNSERSNWVGTIFKTPTGYRLPVLTADKFESGNGSNNILDIADNLSMISVKKLGAPVSMGGLVVAPTADGGAIVSQVAVQSPADVYLHRITPANTIAWSNQVRLDGNEKVYQLFENTDGSFVGAGSDDNNAMLMFPLSNGQTGCKDTALNITYTDVPTTTGSYSPQTDQAVSPLDMSIALGMQAYNPVESFVSCHGFDSCYKMNNGPLLCGNADAVFTEVFPDTINQCTDNEFFAINKGTALYNVYRDSLKNSFEQDYINTALKAADLEKFTVNYQTREYHYTLYYYDQAGNLVKTVPPAGVVVDRSDAWLNDVQAARAEGRSKLPAHRLVTRYRYNTLNQVIAQITPDAGISRFWYDRLGRLAVSQNAKQLAASPDRYSYTLYDTLGRITEVGEISSATAMTDNISRSVTALANWINTAGNSKAQITRTVYDLPHSPLEGLVWDATNLRNRVSWTGLYSNNTDMQDGKRVSGTFYSYDILGNVNMLLQDYNLGPARDSVNRFKKIVYDYDLISGKVNKVSYQPGMKDAFYHRYNYDAENRLTNVETSADGIYWENDAYYQYYKHGPLARMVLGQQQVQGLDYAYTLQGWLKGVNSTNMTVASDMGHDGATGGITARDAFGFALHYFGGGDYKPVGAGLHPFADAESAGSRFKPLFNGNIGMMSVNLPKVGEPLLYAYSYDVLNRLVKMDAARNLNTTTNNWEPVSLDDYQENISYDPNGNILTYNRNGNPTASGKPADMDRLTYNYIANTNKLDHIVDAGNTQYENDIRSQGAGNYGYDEIGNMTKDVGAGIGVGGIEWTVYGKIRKIVKTDPSTSATTTITYEYDPGGNRISKNVNGKVTRYVRDAAGNVMSVYVYDDPAVNSGKMSQTEVHLYGSSRLGISNRVTDVENSLLLPLASINGLESTSSISFLRDQKFFELSNHLGNVLATVSDVKKARSENGSTIDHFDADLVSAQDYYPFGMLEPGRNWNIGNYRYGFNGKENDNEVKGEANQQDYGMRIYDPRAGRFLSVDPLTRNFPYYTPYQFAGNKPIMFIDLDGAEVQIPRINEFKYGNNVPLNVINVVNNAGVILINGGIDLVNSTLYVASNARNPSKLGNQLTSEVQELSNNVSQLAAYTYQYHAETPWRQQLKDAGRQLVSADQWQVAANFAVGYAVGKFELPKFNSSLKIGNIASSEEFALYRRESNVGEFAELGVPMQLREVKKVAEQAGVGLKGVKLKIARDPEFLKRPFLGLADKNSITLFPNAFKDYETLVRTLGHERTHVYQISIWGRAADSKMLGVFEESAYGIEDTFWNFYKSKPAKK